MFKKILIILLSILIVPAFMNFIPTANGAEFSVKGDLNCDGEFNISDVIILQKWLVSAPDTDFPNWKSADFCKDNRIDVFDLILIKKELVQPSITVQPEVITAPMCKSAIFACRDEQELLYCHNIYQPIAPASLTKLLTASVALHYLKSDTIITVGTEQNLVKPQSSLCLIQKGHRLRLYDLLTGMLMASGNDAAYSVAVATARTVFSDIYMTDQQAVICFAELMNSYADSIGMKNSHFTTPEGWDDSQQYTTAYDLLILAEHAYSIPEIREITGTSQKYVVFASGENITWKSTNYLLDSYSTYYCQYAVGMKTGTTANAGNCLIAVFEKNEKTYFSVVTGCNSNSDRYVLILNLSSEFS